MPHPSFLIRRTLAIILSCALTGHSATAGPIADAAAEAENLLANGAPGEIWGQFDRATELFWAEAPLAFRRAVLVHEVQGFGQYLLREEAPYRSGDRLVAYLEPLGFGWTPIGDQFRVRFIVDVEVASVGAGLLLAEPGFLTIERLSNTRSREFQATLELVLPDLPADDYRLTIAFHDAATGKTGEVTIPFEIVP